MSMRRARDARSGSIAAPSWNRAVLLRREDLAVEGGTRRSNAEHRVAMSKLADAIKQNPAGAFLAFLALHFLVWTALPALFFRNLPLDLIEALVYGREWQLGYDKLPPLPWWLAEIAYRVFGADVFYYLLAQLALCAAFPVVFLLGRRLGGAAGALVAALCIDG